MILGITKAELGGTVTDGDQLCTNAAGELIKSTDVDYYVIGHALEGGVDGDVIRVFLTHTGSLASLAGAGQEAFTAAADYSTTGQNLAVKVHTTAGEVTRATTGGEAILGILTNAPTSGASAEVRTAGNVLAMAGDTVTAGDSLAVEVTTSRLITAVSGDNVVGWALAAGTDGATFSVYLIGPQAPTVVVGSTLADTNVWVGDGSGVAAAVAVSGDATLANTGALSVNDLTLGSDAQGDIAMRGASEYNRIAIGSEGDTLKPDLAGTGLNWGPNGLGFTHIIGSYCAPVGAKNGVAGALPDGADTTISNISLGNGYPNMAIYNTGTNTTNEMPLALVDANCCDGLQLPVTNTDNVGCTITFGSELKSLAAAAAPGPTCYMVGTSPAFYMEATFGFPDISDYDVFGIGFVEPAAAYVAAIDTVAELQGAYDEKAMFCLADVAGDIDINTSLAGSDVNTDVSVTDLVDDAVKTIRILVSAAGVVTYQWFDAGVEDVAFGAVAFTFANTTIVTPMIIIAKGANATDTPPILQDIKWGYQ